MNRNLTILAIAQALGASSGVMITLLGGIIGTQLAPGPTWATLPIFLMIIGTGLSVAPAALFMKRSGRRAGFLLGTVFALIGALCASLAMWLSDFVVFLVGAVVLGVSLAFVQQYRYAAAESVDPNRAARAISTVLLGTVGAAWLGPEIVKHTRDLLPATPHLVSFLVLGAVALCATVLMSFFQEPTAGSPRDPVSAKPSSGRGLPIAVAMIASVAAYGVMNLLMAATPISMHVHDGHSLADTAWVIQSHVIAMFLPSLVTGRLIDRFGITTVMTLGLLSMSACIAVALTGHEVVQYWSALVLLGVGWNFLFIGGTTLLTRTVRSDARFRFQALNDFATFSVAAFAALASGALVHHTGWQFVNLVAIPMLGLMLFGIIRLGLRERVSAAMARS